MLTVEQALEIVLTEAEPLGLERAELSDCLGRVLAESAWADLDMPPFDKSIVDGWAVRSADLSAGVAARLRPVGESVAGRVPTAAVEAGTTVKTMTGAPLPTGADAVVMVEKSRLTDSGEVELTGPVPAGQNVARQGHDIREGDEVLPAGTVLTPAAVGVLAAVGIARPLVHRRPRVTVLATGDEIVPVAATPTGAQIRNSNSHSLAAQAASAGARVTVLPPAADTMDALDDGIAEGLRSDVLILSGGVSMGDHDLVPAALRACGVEVRAHKVAVKPGKPFLLGVPPRRDPKADRGLVFGLPGNPVSSFVCFELFVRPALRKMAGHPSPAPATLSAETLSPLPLAGDRRGYLPGRLVHAPGDPRLRVERLEWKGSADLFTLARADCLIIRDIGSPAADPGASVSVLPIRES